MSLLRQLDDQYGPGLYLTWMREALDQARRAEADGEVPVGAVLVRDGVVVARACNGPIGHNDPTRHAEIAVLREAARSAQNYRLPGSVMVVTLEPCVMCVGAMVQARVAGIVYGATEPRTGAVHSQERLLDSPALLHRIAAEGGVLAEESRALLQNFFRSRRNRRNDGD